jgi:hypothetical protein
MFDAIPKQTLLALDAEILGYAANWLLDGHLGAVDIESQLSDISQHH